jgi:hypothetical protein
MLFGGIALNLVTFLVVLPVNLCHPFAIPPGIPVRLSVGFCFGFILLPIKPPHGFVIFAIKMAESFLIPVSAIPVPIIIIRIGIVGASGWRIRSTATKSIGIIGWRITVRAGG